ncbi:MAG TPA: SusC/RagA family TonB-linked outer membrane protein [Pedobacter sp.]|uniref:SusC/RagA family TonB-linked outer membrane protein n=1 Tax=Pedobacter sp. TaxID=1411316 RepID=UPI002C37ED3E|nr:SusC/RagA family TonB-linked outer membrane protein [Pedobacter sp.]HMI02521.1 SusC/RagA family TonB-linked outer membrane protein [Pedobacter sp.]
MKKLLQSLFILLFVASSAMAQDRTITGTVTGKDDGQPLPGVTVLVKGTKIGTQTGSDGKFALSVPSNAAQLEFSYLGYATQTLAATGAVVNVALESDSKSLTEVVVTALGISKEKKTLGYSQTTVKSDVINASSPVGLLTGLQGKVAGLNISNVSGSPGGTTKVILRGYSSIFGNNQPLYVIDGVPFDNSRLGSDNNYDFGNSGNDIDPNIIDNMSILKGSEATALYGGRGSNGVIIITTKKGKAGKPIVDFNSSTSLTNVAITYTPQDVYGQGWGQEFILSENGSWGPKLDGVVRPWGATGATLGSKQLIKPFVAIKDNVAGAFDNGLELNNSVSIRGGSDVSTYFLSYANVYSDGVLPSKADLYKKNNFTFSGSTKYKNFTADASLNYVNNVRNFVATGQGSTAGSTFYESLLQMAVDVPIKDLRDYKNEFFNVDNYFTPFAENPFYSLYENGAKQTSNRVYGNINLNYKAASWLTINFQQSADVSNRYDKIWNNKNKPSPGSWNDGNNVENAPRAADIGSVTDESFNQFEYDTKLQALFTKQLSSDFDLNGLVGASYNDRGTRALSTSIEDLAIPGFYQINNSLNKPSSAESNVHRKIMGFYGQATVGYKGYAYVTVTGREDITSTLFPGKNSYFYPAVNGSFILSDALNFTGSIVTFAKIRAGYGETGADADPYSIYNTLSATNIPLGFGNTSFPINNVAGYSINNTLYQSSLKPERVSEYEIGGDFRFLGDRVTLDVTYYNRIRKNQPLPAPISPSSGYTSAYINFAKARNRGVELALGIVPVKTADVRWDVNYTFSRDRSLVLELSPGIERLTLRSAYDASLVALKGQPLGVIQAPVAATDPEGHIIVDSQGFPTQKSDVGTYGNIQADFRMGVNSTVKYKNVSLGFTVDYSKGGVFYSGTADLLNFVGNDTKTLYNDRNPWIVPNSVQAVKNAAGETTGYVENTTPLSEANVTSYYYPTSNKGTSYQNRILDRTFAKLREVVITYDLPKSVAAKIGGSSASIRIFGRNLYTWLPSSNRTVDPEVSNLGSDLGSEFGEFRTSPPLRNYGASLRVSF